MLTPQDPEGGRVITARALHSWTARLMERIGTPPDIATDVADVLVAADLRGIASHGTARLPQYVKLVEAGVLDPAARPLHEKGRVALARFDARNGWGHHAGRVASDDAVSRARDVGCAASVVRNANHFGIAGWYAMRAADQGLIGVALSNTSPVVAPTRARIPMLGTNPIAVAAPAGRFGMVVLDMATSTVPYGRLEVAARRRQPLPAGWAIGPEGLPAATPEEAFQGALLPLGGGEETAGYKGYGLALAVEILTGILGDAAFGPNILGLFSTEGRSNLGQFFLAIDPAAVDGTAAFSTRLEKLVSQLTSAPTVHDAPGPVLYAGQPEAETSDHQVRYGIVIDPEHLRSMQAVGERYQLPFPRVRSLGRRSARRSAPEEPPPDPDDSGT
jgi:L-2-hydroxycarboxylate dehydrogenase (NAD+)